MIEWNPMFMKRTISPVLVTAGWLAVCTAFAQPASSTSPAPAKAASKPAELFPDSVIAKGKGVEVKRSQLDDEVVRIKAQYTAHNTPIPADRVTLLEQQVLDNLIQLQLVQAKATDADREA